MAMPHIQVAAADAGTTTPGTSDLAAGSQSPATTDEASPNAFACPICMDLLLRPVATTCGHAFCLSCFEAWRLRVIRDPRQRGPLACPVCRHKFPIDWVLNTRPPLAPVILLSDAISQLCPRQDAARRQRHLLEQQAEEQSQVPGRHSSRTTTSSPGEFGSAGDTEQRLGGMSHS